MSVETISKNAMRPSVSYATLPPVPTFLQSISTKSRSISLSWTSSSTTWVHSAIDFRPITIFLNMPVVQNKRRVSLETFSLSSPTYKKKLRSFFETFAIFLESLIIFKIFYMPGEADGISSSQFWGNFFLSVISFFYPILSIVIIPWGSLGFLRAP